MRHRRSKAIAVIGTLSMGILLGSPAGISASDPGTGLMVVDCPADVLEFAVTQVTCATLAVPLDRMSPDGRTIDLLTVETMPPGGTATLDPGFGVGAGLGSGCDGTRSTGGRR
jgi:hypothetical protein